MPPRFRSFFPRFAEFEWDPQKSDRCFRERGFDFGFAAAIFSQEILRRRDTRSRHEARFQAIGEVSGIILFVVYTVRSGRCRIVSARVATQEEARLRDGW